ncbi:hypothetical protein [Rhizobium sp. F40D2]|uniref:hypothetical protein n=1 Tax=Rhizobium sp. F40D2 TaxID=3453141 RepID=UPI003F236FD1
MRISAAIIVSSLGIIGLMSLDEARNQVSMGPRIVLPAMVSPEQNRTQQSRLRLDKLRGALLQQKQRLRAKSANDGIVLPT